MVIVLFEVVAAHAELRLDRDSASGGVNFRGHVQVVDEAEDCRVERDVDQVATSVPRLQVMRVHNHGPLNIFGAALDLSVEQSVDVHVKDEIVL